MGQLTNLYVSQSYQGLIKLADSTTGVTNTLQYTQDGVGNNLPIQISTTQVNITGSFLVNGQPISVDSGSLVTTASFNAYTSSNDSRVNSLISQTGSYVTETESGSFMITGSVSGNVLTFTKGDGSQFNLTVDTGSVTPINTGSFATTGSNIFIGNQTISGSLLVSGSEVVTGPLTASRLQINGVTDLNGVLDVSNDATFHGDLYVQQSTNPKIRLRDTAGGGHSDGFDIQISTSSFVLTDKTHNFNFLEFDYNSGTTDHTLKLRANKFELNSGSLDVSGSLTASLQEGYVWVGGTGNISTAVPTSSFIEDLSLYTTTASFNAYTSSTDNRLNSIETETGSFATTGSNQFSGSQEITGALTLVLYDEPYDSYFKIAEFGAPLGDYFQFNSNVEIDSGNLTVAGDIKTNGITDKDGSNILTISGSQGLNIVGQTNVDGHLIVNGPNGNLTVTGNTIMGGTLKVGNGINVTGSIFGTSTVTSLGGFSGDLSGTASYATNALTASYALNSAGGGSVDTGSFATTGSNVFIGNQTITGSLTQSGSLIHTGSFNQAGNIFLRPQFLSALTFNHVTQSNEVSASNIIGMMLNSPTLTGSIILSGSNNIILNAQRSATPVGSIGLMNGSGNILTSTVFPTLSSGSLGSFTFDRNIGIGVPTVFAPYSGSLNSVFSNNIGANGFNLNNYSGSANIAGNGLQGTLTVNNGVSASTTGIQSISLTQNAIFGTHTVTMIGTAVGTPRLFSTNLIAGNTSTIFSNVATNTGSLQSTLIVGNNLIVSASSGNSAGIAGALYGGAFVGRYNDDSGRLANTHETVFAVGTGTGTGARRTSLLVSGSGLTVVRNGLDVTGSLTAPSITGSLEGTASYATNALTASFALNGGGGTVDTGSFATTGSNEFSGSQEITGALKIISYDQPYDSYFTFAEFNVANDPAIQFNTNTRIDSGNLTVAGDIKGNFITDKDGTSVLTISGSQGISISGSISVANGITGSLEGTSSYATNALTASYALSSAGGGSINTGSFAITGSNQFSGSQEITGALTLVIYDEPYDSYFKVAEFGATSGDYFQFNSNVEIDSGNLTVAGDIKTNGITDKDGSNPLTISGSQGISISGSISVANGITGSLEGTSSYATNALTASYALNSPVVSPFPFTGSAVITGSLNVIGDTVMTGSLILSGSANPELTVIGNTILTGSVQGNVNALSISSNTASLDLNTGNFFTLQLVSGSNTFINPSNIKAGQTVNILLSTTGSATVSFPTSVDQVSGSAYVPTATTGKDIITLVSFDSSTLYLANVKNLI
jgi:fibronectin-binding autotransporter adhesin